jgi:hypothetical protein
MKRPARVSSQLSDSLNHHLNMYATAATAAGVGLLALAPLADAKIVYTPTHQLITKHHGYVLNLNHDAYQDFAIDVLRSSRSMISLVCTAFNHSSHSGGNSIAGIYASSIRFAYAIKKGTKIGHSQFQTFLLSQGVMASHRYGKWHGHWINVQDRYLGFSFLVKKTGKHYGWARLSVKVTTTDVTAMLTGYAYETIPDKPIIAGQTKGPDDSGVQKSNTTPANLVLHPASLGALAMGAPGLSIWRRKEVVGATVGSSS